MTSLPPSNRSSAGFTLIEAMITVAVIAIVAAVALPSYFEYITRSRIVEAKTNLADMRTRLEQFFLDNRKYPTSCDPGPTTAINISPPGNEKFFHVTCAFGLTPPTYLVTATGQGSMLNFIYTIDQANIRATTSTGAWGKSSTTCWISKKSGEC
jgi:prepilin-type N-terminal cleavage/methylation domain-containing protein